MYEAEDRLGGHAHTHDVVTPDAGTIAVDTGFIVYNERTYPALDPHSRGAGSGHAPPEMSMSIRCEGCGFAYAGGRGLWGLGPASCSPTPVRADAGGGEAVSPPRPARPGGGAASDDLTPRPFLRSGRFSDYFVGHFWSPIVSCVWSVDAGSALEFPARYLFAFLDNHGMLSVTGSPSWRTVVGGSRTYVERAAKDLTAVSPRHARARRSSLPEGYPGPRRVTGCDPTRQGRRGDHADTALRLLADPTAVERSTLGAFTYSRNETWLHADDRLLPRAPRYSASWNCLLPACRPGETPYWCPMT